MESNELDSGMAAVAWLHLQIDAGRSRHVLSELANILLRLNVDYRIDGGPRGRELLSFIREIRQNLNSNKENPS